MAIKRKKDDPKRAPPGEPRGESVEKPSGDEGSIEAAPDRQPGEPKGFPPPPGSTKGYDNPAQGLV